MNTNIIDLEDYLENREAMPDIQSIAGERWFTEETSITEDMTKYWGGDFGVSSECNKLRAVLLHRPGKEVDNFDANVVRFRAPIDPEKFRKQHDVLADYYRSHGIKVFYVDEQREDRPNAVFERDNVFMTPEGAIVMRLAMPQRRGEERYTAQALAKIGVPIDRKSVGRERVC